MYQFFVEPTDISEKTVEINGADVNHISNVLRMKIGEEISIVNGVDGKDYLCEIQEFQEDKIICLLKQVIEDGIELSSKIYLFQGLPKADKMELIIQKAVELGVFEIIPVSTKRCIVKLDEKKAIGKIARWQEIAKAAAKQSKRKIIPEIHSVLTWKQALDYCKGFDIKMIPYENENGMFQTKEIINHLKTGQKIAVFIGPEGGFEESEIEEAKQRDILPVSLGKRILRTETAGITMLSWLMYQLED